MKRTVLTTLVLLLAVGSIAIAKDREEYAGIGEGSGFLWGGCGTDSRLHTKLFKRGRCEGVLRAFPDQDTVTDPSIIQEVLERSWEGRVGPVASLSSSRNGAKPRVWVESIDEAAEVALAKLGTRRYIAARMIADPEGPSDKRYGLGASDGRSTHRRTGVYYLVVHGYSVDDDTEYGNDTVGKSRRIARWDVYAAEAPNGQGKAANRLVRIRNSGSLQYCAHRHELDGSTPSANFWHCAVPEKVIDLARALSRDTGARLTIAQALGESSVKTTDQPSMAWVISGVRAIVDQQRVNAISDNLRTQVLELYRLLRDTDNPVWFRCGVGCCIADT
jgi:hypothetical protein